MSADRSNAAPNGNAPSATWTALLECAESAEDGDLDLDGGAPQVVDLAEHLVDLGFLRVPRAGHYALTQAGRELLGQSRTGTASIRPRRRVALVFLGTLAAVAAAVFLLWSRS
jgi:hypothetical protein|tara:strand:- start:316 stop:654 length:339 start_codon:yes stop_codon:yes gene_type:complete